MNIDNLNKWITTAANIGVLAGIVFLVLELRHYQDQMDLQLRADALESRVSALRLAATSPEISGIIVKFQMGEELSPEEDLRLGFWVRTIIFSDQFNWEEHQSGRLENWDMAAAVVRLKFNFWGYATQWEAVQRGAGLNPEFVAALEAELMEEQSE